MAIAPSGEIITLRQPRSFVLEKKGEALSVNGEQVNSISNSDNNYFKNTGYGAISLKLFFLIANGLKKE